MFVTFLGGKEQIWSAAAPQAPVAM